MCTLSWYFLAEGEEKRGPGHRGAAGARVTWFWMMYIFFLLGAGTGGGRQKPTHHYFSSMKPILGKI